MKKIRAYGTPEKKKKKRDEEMVYIEKNQPNEVVYVEANQASLKEHDRADWNHSDQKNENKTTEAIFII